MCLHQYELKGQPLIQFPRVICSVCQYEKTQYCLRMCHIYL